MVSLFKEVVVSWKGGALREPFQEIARTTRHGFAFTSRIDSFTPIGNPGQPPRTDFFGNSGFFS
jgi:hypothetical protein